MYRQTTAASIVLALAGALVVGMAASPAAAQSTGPKIYISADMEGLTGSVTADQLGPAGFEYATSGAS